MNQITNEILSRLDIVEIISRYVPLKKSGSNFSGNCPFHNEKTPSFMVSPTKQIFKCFGCGKGGNVITFMQEIERIDFRDAIKELAKIGNIDLEKYQFEKQKTEDLTDEKEKIKHMHRLAQQFFIEELEKNSEALNYLKEKRKLNENIIKHFCIGYAPESNYGLINFLKSKGFTDHDIIQASLGKRGQNQDIYAFFRKRITFPIFDTMQNIIGFSARCLDPNDKPKYLNSAEHKAFDKSSILYGLNRAKNNIKIYDAIIIVEGQMDVIGLARLDFPIGVATSGTSLTEQHMKILKRYTNNIYFLFDNDQAGQMATLRALSIAYQNNIFPKKIILPGGIKDVDELANIENGKHIFQKQFEEAEDGFNAICKHLLNSHNIQSPLDKQKILNTMFELIININNIPMQDHYLHILGEKLDIKYEIILSQYKQYAKNDGKFIIRQIDKKSTNNLYQPDRNELINALLKNNFINTYIQTPQLREPLLELIKKLQSLGSLQMTTNLSDNKENNSAESIELQLRREKELENKDETKQLEIIKKTIGQIIQNQIQQLLKNQNISNEEKQILLKMKKNLQ